MRAAWIVLVLVAACGLPTQEPAADDVARVYQVFFDWNSARLTDEAETTLAGVARLFDGGRSFPIMVVGHADPREDVPELRQRRAQAVVTRLVRLGIAPGRISVAVANMAEIGEALAGPAEPQHRRAQIERR